MSNCRWCRLTANIEHILISCTFTKELHFHILKHNDCFSSAWNDSFWIFGCGHMRANQIIWLTNFAIYKCHLGACEGYQDDFFHSVLFTINRYVNAFSDLSFQDGLDDGTSVHG